MSFTSKTAATVITGHSFSSIASLSLGQSIHSEPPLPPSLAWRRAVDRHLQDNTLSVEEQKVLRLSSPGDFTGDLQSLSLTYLQTSRLRKGLEKVRGLFDQLERFNQAIDLFAQADSFGVLSLLWGSVRMCMVVMKDFAELYEVLIECLLDIQSDIGRLTAYEALFAKNKRFNLALCVVFESLLEFCAWFRMRTRSKAKFVAKMVFLGSMKKEAALKISKFHALCIKTESEAQLAGAESTAKFQESASRLLKDVSRAQQAQVAGLNNELLKTLHDKLAPIPVAEYLDSLMRKRFQGTCSWIMSSQHLGNLLSADRVTFQPQVTWLTGVPGCGKTVLSAYIIQQLQAIYPIGYFFCDTNEVTRRTSANVLRTWAWQLCSTASGIAGEALRLVNPVVEITTKLILDVFKLALKRQNAFLIIDGLDECETEERAEILTNVGHLARLAHIIIVSRKERDIDSRLRDLEDEGAVPVNRLQIKSTDTEADIRRYLIKEVENCAIKDPVLCTKIVTEVGTRARGMFLYAKLVLHELNQSDTDEERHEVLQSLPEGIEQVYGRSMAKIKGLKKTRRARVLRLLQCVLYATRPLTLTELEVALAVVPGESVFRPGNVSNVSKLFLEFCTSLLELDEEGHTLVAIHATAKEYLTSASGELQLTDPATAHAEILTICLTYLNFEDRTFVDRSEIDVTDIPMSEPWPWFEYLHFPFQLHLEEYRFIQYSAANWPIHFAHLAAIAKMNESISKSLTALRDLLWSEEKLLRWLEIFHFANTENLDGAHTSSNLIDAWILQYEDIKLGPDAFAEFAEKQAFGKFAWSFNGFAMVDTSEADALRKETTIYPSEIILRQLESSWSFALDHLGFSSRYGIHRWRRFVKIEPITRKPVHMAAFFDFTDFVVQQLSAGIDVNDRCATDRSIINKAAFGEATNTAKVLLEHGADIDQCPEFTFFDGNRPIMHALFDDQFVPLRPRDYSTANFLLDMGAKVQVPANPLHPLHTIFDFWTETDAQMEVLNKILDHAEDIISLLEMPSPYSGMTPLHSVARNNNPETVQLFLARHSKPKRYASMPWGADGRTALHEACFATRSRCGQALIDTGMDVNIACNISGSTPLHIAATTSSDMLPVLLAAGADASMPDGAGRFPLHLAALQDSVVAIQLLVPHTQDINAQDLQGYTAFALASRQGCKEAAKALLQAGASQNMHHRQNGSSSPVYQPATSSDIFQAYFTLSCAFNFRAQKDLIIHILDAAEYWLRSTSHVTQPFAVQQADSGRPYLVSRPLSLPGSTIRKCVINITSEATEGEYTALYPEKKSWTWFKLDQLDASTKEMLGGPKLVENKLDREGRQQFTCEIYATDKQLGNDIAIWLGRLRKGDALALIPMARWPQRVNTVYEARLEIHTNLLKGEADASHGDTTRDLTTEWGNWKL